MNGITSCSGEAGGGRPVITAPTRLVVHRPRHGWVAGLVSAGVTVIARLVAAAVALAVLAGVTAVLWWAGQARVPLLVLVYGAVAVAGGGFALGRSGRLLAPWPRLPHGPTQLTWEPGAGRVETGLVWEQDPLPFPGPAEPSQEEGCS